MRRLLALLLLLFLGLSPTTVLAGGTIVCQGGTCTTMGAASGDLVGPAVSVDNGIARYDGTTGKLLQSYTSNTPTCGDTGICTFVAPVLGTPTSGTLTNATGLPAAGVVGTALVSADIGTTVQAYDADLTTWAGVTPGTGVATALGVNVGTGGAFVVNGGVLGTPSSGTATNLTGLPLTTGVTGILPLANGGMASDTTGAATDSVLRFNGTTWVAGSPVTSSAGPGIEFFNATPAIEVDDADNDVPINTLSKTPIVTAEQTISGTGDGASTAIAFGAWLYDTALGRTTIDAGQWQFETYVAINVAGGTTTLTRQVYAVVPVVTGTVTVTGTGTSRTATASAGTPFNTTDVTGSATSTTASYLQTPKGLYQITARSGDTVVTILTPSGYTNDSAATFNVWRKLVTSTTDDINDISPAYTLHTFNVVSGAFTITALTKLGAISFVASTASRTITLAYNGTTHNTHFSTPLVTMHNNLAGLDGGTAGQFYHLTSAEYTGVGTDVFVRKTAPTFVTSITSPLVIGGTTTTSTLSLQSTSGVGTTGADIIFKVGNNGATEAARILNNGNIGIGTTGPNGKLSVLGNTVGAVNFDFGNTTAQAVGAEVRLRLQPSAIFSQTNPTLGPYISGIQTNASNSASDIAFGTWNGGAQIEVARLQASGNVGIGTTGPASLLDLRVGEQTFSGANGQKYVLGHKTELTTIAAAATTATTITIPANAILKAVTMRVTTVIPTATTMVVTATTTGTVLQQGASISVAAGTTDIGTRGWGTNFQGVAAQTITITPNATPGAATGVVRFDIFYEEPTVPTS